MTPQEISFLPPFFQRLKDQIQKEVNNPRYDYLYIRIRDAVATPKEIEEFHQLILDHSKSHYSLKEKE